jgi:asparagine synthase (glutamine-hydrolysing)
MPPLFDEPFCDSGAWAFWAVSRMARRHVTVALSGEGADELFLGYPRHAKQTAPVLPAPLAAAARLAPTMSLTGRSLQRRSSSGFARYLNLYGAFTTAQQKALLHPAILDASNGDPAASFAAHWRDDLDPRKAMQWLDLNTSLHDWMLTKVDRTSMAHGLEVRPPFLDHRVVEFALTLHPDLLRPTGAGPGKQLLRSLMRPKLPSGHLDRPKSGFNLPIRRYVKQDPRLLDRALDRLADAKIIRRPRLAGYAGEQVWALLVLDRWLTATCATS